METMEDFKDFFQGNQISLTGKTINVTTGASPLVASMVVTTPVMTTIPHFVNQPNP